MFRTVVLSLSLLFSVIASLPLTATLVEWTADAAVSKKKSYRRHSSAYWRRRRALWRRRQALLRRRRAALLARRRRLARQRAAALARLSNHPSLSNAVMTRASLDFPLPVRWSSVTSSGGDQTRYVVRAPSGAIMGTVSISQVTPRASVDMPPSFATRRKVLGGAPLVSLRRIVIDRMIEEGGWVVNDWEQEIGGRRVYVVLAQAGSASTPAVANRFWNFYFVEAGGNIYSLVVNGPVDFANPLAFEAEQALASLRLPATQTLTARSLK